MNKLHKIKRIAIFIPSFRGGGAERSMITIAAGLLKSGYDVDFIVANDSGPLKSLLPEEANLINLNVSRVILALPGLIRYLRKIRPEAIYTTIVHSNIITLFATKLSLTNTKAIIRESNAPLIANSSSPGFIAKIVARMVPVIYPWAYAIISVSEEIVEQLCLLNPKLRKKIFVFPNPVVSPEFIDQANDPLEHPWFSHSAPPVILGVGRLHPQKDFSTLIKAFAKVRKNRPARLIILGEGGERESLERLVEGLGIKSDVELAGFKVNPFPYMKLAKVFVLSSKYEGMPNVLVQAMALGTPVVSTDCKTGPKELTLNGQLGALVPVGDAELMALEISKALDLHNRPDTAEYITENYGSKKAVDQYISLIN